MDVLIVCYSLGGTSKKRNHQILFNRKNLLSNLQAKLSNNKTDNIL